MEKAKIDYCRVEARGWNSDFFFILDVAGNGVDCVRISHGLLVLRVKSWRKVNKNILRSFMIRRSTKLKSLAHAVDSNLNHVEMPLKYTYISDTMQ